MTATFTSREPRWPRRMLLGQPPLLWAERPEMSYLEIKDAILNNTRADHLNLVTNGVLDLGLAMTAITGSTNSPPVAVNDTATVDEDSFVAVNVLQNDSDPRQRLPCSSIVSPARPMDRFPQATAF